MIRGGISADLHPRLLMNGIAVQIACIGTVNHRHHSPRLTGLSFADFVASMASPRWKLLVKFLPDEFPLQRLSVLHPCR